MRITTTIFITISSLPQHHSRIGENVCWSTIISIHIAHCDNFELRWRWLMSFFNSTSTWMFCTLISTFTSSSCSHQYSYHTSMPNDHPPLWTFLILFDSSNIAFALPLLCLFWNRSLNNLFHHSRIRQHTSKYFVKFLALCFVDVCKTLWTKNTQVAQIWSSLNAKYNRCLVLPYTAALIASPTTACRHFSMLTLIELAQSVYYYLARPNRFVKASTIQFFDV